MKKTFLFIICIIILSVEAATLAAPTKSPKTPIFHRFKPRFQWPNPFKPSPSVKTQTMADLGKQVALRRLDRIVQEAKSAADRFYYNNVAPNGAFINKNNNNKFVSKVVWLRPEYKNGYVKDFKEAFNLQNDGIKSSPKHAQLSDGFLTRKWRTIQDWIYHRAPGANDASKYRNMIESTMKGHSAESKKEFMDAFLKQATEIHESAFKSRILQGYLIPAPVKAKLEAMLGKVHETTKTVSPGLDATRSLPEIKKDIDPSFNRNTKYQVLQRDAVKTGLLPENARIKPYRLREKFLAGLLTIIIFSWIWNDRKRSEDDLKMTAMEQIYNQDKTRSDYYLV